MKVCLVYNLAITAILFKQQNAASLHYRYDIFVASVLLACVLHERTYTLILEVLLVVFTISYNSSTVEGQERRKKRPDIYRPEDVTNVRYSVVQVTTLAGDHMSLKKKTVVYIYTEKLTESWVLTNHIKEDIAVDGTVTAKLGTPGLEPVIKSYILQSVST